MKPDNYRIVIGSIMVKDSVSSVFDSVRVDIVKETAFLTLSDIANKNSLSDTMLDSLSEGLSHICEYEEVNILVLQHLGLWFSSGMDLAAGDFENAFVFGDILKFLSSCQLVTIAAIDGKVAGGGVGLAAACDVVIASKQATFCLPEALWGLVPAVSFPALLNRITPAKIKELAITTRTIDAPTAQSIGLIDSIAYPIHSGLSKMIARCRCVDKETIGLIKQLFVETRHNWEEEAQELALSILQDTMSSQKFLDRVARWSQHGIMPWEGYPS